MTVVIDPRSSIVYGSFYIYAFRKVFGHRHVKYDSAPFVNLQEPDNNIRFIIVSESCTKKYFINTDDSCDIRQDMYLWCDIYGSVNANFSKYPKSGYPKLVSLAPSFAIRCYSFWETLFISIRNLSLCWKEVMGRTRYNKYSAAFEHHPMSNIKRYLFDYLKLFFRRKPYSDYAQGESRKGYVFFLSTLWFSDKFNNNDTGVNYRRSLFIRACQNNPAISFEGGLVGDNSSSNDVFSDVLANKKEPFSNWIRKTKLSSFVFNTPAFWGCHGWKLGEYLALGKCIISTGLTNDLPAPLIHGEHIFYVEDTFDDMVSAVNEMARSDLKIKKMEIGASEYWEKYGTPEKSLELLGITK